MKTTVNALAFVLLVGGGCSPAIAQAEIKAGFSKGEPTAQAVVLESIGDATSSIRLAAYQFTSKEIIQALTAAKQRGVDVAVVLDRTQQNGDSQAVMVAAGMGCRIDKSFRIMHHKFIVVDGRHVQTGSFNYSGNAHKVNAENALYLKHVPALAKAYTAEWDMVNGRAEPCKGGGL